MPTDSPTSAGTALNGNGPDRRSVEERRGQLIEAALTVMARDGLGRATTRAITDEAGLALGAFHYAFTSKDELLAAVIERVANEIDATLAETLADECPDGPGERGPEATIRLLHRFLERIWEYLESTRDLQLAQYELTLHTLREPALQHLPAHQYGLYTRTVARGLTEVLPPAHLDAAEELGRFVVATIDGLLLQWLVEEDTEAARRRLGRYLAVLPAMVAAHLDT